MLTLLLSRFLPSGASKLVAAIALAVVIVGAASAVYALRVNAAYKRGWHDALASVAQINQASADAASKVRVTVDQCFDKGGTWDVVKANCIIVGE